MNAFDFHPAVPVFDANVRVGPAHVGAPDSMPTDRAAMLREFDERGVARGLVYHAHAASHSARIGWRLLREFVGDHEPRLVLQPCAAPTDDDLAFLRELDEAGELRSLRLGCAADEKLTFVPAMYGPILQLLESRQIPLWMDIWQVEPRDLIDTLQRFPRVPVVLTGAHYMHFLLVKPLMHAIPRLHLELSRYEAHGQIEVLAAEFGAERLIYGSGFPSYAMGPVLYYLHHCPSLSKQQLELICAGNVERLLLNGGAR